MSTEIKFTELQLKWLRRILFILLVASCYFVVYAAWLDLNNPGIQVAKDYQFYAKITLFLMVVIAVPLWAVKIEKIKSWVNSMKAINDPVLRNKAWWSNIKPMLHQIIFVVVLAVIFYFIINTYFHVPQQVIDNYTQYYSSSQVNVSNLSDKYIFEFPNQSTP